MAADCYISTPSTTDCRIERGRDIQVTFVSTAPASDVASVTKDPPTDVACVKTDPAVRPSQNCDTERGRERVGKLDAPAEVASFATDAASDRTMVVASESVPRVPANINSHVVRTLTLFRSAGFWCGERKSSHGNSSKNAHELHDRKF